MQSPVDDPGREREDSIRWRAPALIFLDCRISRNRFGNFVYDRSSRKVTKLNATTDGAEGGSDVEYLAVYQIIGNGHGDGLDEQRTEIQARTTNDAVHYDYRGGEAHHPDILTLGAGEWLGQQITRRAKLAGEKGTWVPYVRTLLGISDDQITTDIQADDDDPINLPLSSLIVLFLKCSNLETRSFLYTDVEGRWHLPPIEGNRGEDEHIFYNATDEVDVEVV